MGNKQPPRDGPLPPAAADERPQRRGRNSFTDAVLSSGSPGPPPPGLRSLQADPQDPSASSQHDTAVDGPRLSPVSAADESPDTITLWAVRRWLEGVKPPKGPDPALDQPCSWSNKG
eukprot:TRINITY_DN6194_c0_g1_i1.p2 TRINITY_DN6194_c0_g1~~TRINITY_DN6194_c0_g1_i1.p2  ORF type:complete len:117 (+),score=25.58 TRINITY_DN6194_c0_g1_i1:71-421(+)